MPDAPRLVELRLPRFKSVRDGVLPLRDVTLLVGRNGSGKSNALEGMWVLSRIARGDDLRDALEDSRDRPSVRGGAAACAPAGSDSFALGCTVEASAGRIHLDLEVQVRPIVRVRNERLWRSWVDAEDQTQRRTLLESTPASDRDGTRLLAPQLPGRIAGTTQAERDDAEAAEQLLDALHAVFVLDPDPRVMRHFVPASDNGLRPDAGNLSAVLARLLDDPDTNARVLAMMRAVSESPIEAMRTVSSELGDVMLTHTEVLGGVESIVPARLMSDGTLRLLAIVAALLDRDDGTSRATIVIDEIENGLHPSQAGALLTGVRMQGGGPRVRTVASTQSPALLDALPGHDHQGVVVCARDTDGWTRLHRLVDLPNYFNVVAAGSLGRAATADRLRPASPSQITDELLDRVLGPR